MAGSVARWGLALAIGAAGWLAALGGGPVDGVAPFRPGPLPAEAASILIQPIQVCDDSGQNCAATALGQTFLDVTSKVYAQLGHTISFLPLKQLASTAFLNIECASNTAPCTEAQTLYAGAGNGQTPGAYNMWFVAERHRRVRPGRHRRQRHGDLRRRGRGESLRYARPRARPQPGLQPHGSEPRRCHEVPDGGGRARSRPRSPTSIPTGSQLDRFGRRAGGRAGARGPAQRDRRHAWRHARSTTRVSSRSTSSTGRPASP